MSDLTESGMEPHVVYITTTNRDEAALIARTLVEERLIACGNIVPDVTSIYRWQGSIHQDNETLLIAKTTRTRVSELIDRVRSIHSYECPVITVWPITDGNPEYLQWIRDQTTGGDATDNTQT